MENKKSFSEMSEEESYKQIKLFLAEKNKNKKRPTQEEVTAEFASLRGKYYVDKNSNFRFIDGSDE